MTRFYAHPVALVESTQIGSDTRIWAHVHVMKGAVIGRECNICDGSFIEDGAVIGRGVTIKPGASICDGVTIEDGVFVGPGVVFTNDQRPRSGRVPCFRQRGAGRDWLRPTLVKEGASIGANATIGCGITLGAWCFVAAGAVVTRDVPPFALVAGNPARPLGFVCICAEPLPPQAALLACKECGRSYRAGERTIEPVEPLVMWPQDAEDPTLASVQLPVG